MLMASTFKASSRAGQAGLPTDFDAAVLIRRRESLMGRLPRSIPKALSKTGACGLDDNAEPVAPADSFRMAA